jgi:cystathionine beta-lyase/cystathionine gamma-synthase
VVRRRAAAAAGVLSGLVRISVGLEHIDDILSHIKQAFPAAGA